MARDILRIQIGLTSSHVQKVLVFLSADEVDRGYVFADAASKVCDFDVLRLDRVNVESCSISKDRNKTGIVGPWQADSIEANLKTFHFRNDTRKVAQQMDMFLTCFLLDIGPVLPDDNVC